MGLHKDLSEVPISALSLRRCPTTTPEVRLREAIRIMRRDQLGAIIVVDEDGRPAGMFNENMLTRILDETPDVLDDPIADHMTTHVVCLTRDDPIAKLIATMFQRNLQWVCIVNREGRPVSFSGLRGVIEYVADYFPHQVMVQPTTSSKLAMDEREGA